MGTGIAHYTTTNLGTCILHMEVSINTTRVSSGEGHSKYFLKVDIEVLHVSLASFGRVLQIDIMFGKEEF